MSSEGSARVLKSSHSSSRSSAELDTVVELAGASEMVPLAVRIRRQQQNARPIRVAPRKVSFPSYNIIVYSCSLLNTSYASFSL